MIGLKILAPLQSHPGLAASPNLGEPIQLHQVTTARCRMSPSDYVRLAYLKGFPPGHLAPEELCECGLYAWSPTEVASIVRHELLPFAIAYAWDQLFLYGEEERNRHPRPSAHAREVWRHSVANGRAHALALVEGFGKVIVHERGWRAEKLRFMALIEADWPSAGLPLILLEDLPSVLSELA